MPYVVTLNKNIKANGQRQKAGDALEVSDELFEELNARGLVASFEEPKKPKRTTSKNADEVGE